MFRALRRPGGARASLRGCLGVQPRRVGIGLGGFPVPSRRAEVTHLIECPGGSLVRSRRTQMRIPGMQILPSRRVGGGRGRLPRPLDVVLTGGRTCPQLPEPLGELVRSFRGSFRLTHHEGKEPVAKLSLTFSAVALCLVCACSTSGKYVWVDDYEGPRSPGEQYVIAPGDRVSYAGLFKGR